MTPPVWVWTVRRDGRYAARCETGSIIALSYLVAQVSAGLLARFRLDGRVAVVTGAGRGIGAAGALALAEAGADVVLAARTAEQLDAVAGGVREFGRRAVTVPLDMATPEAPATLVAAALDAFGRIDVVVNNVGGTWPRPFLDTTPGFLEEAFHFNVTTAFELSRLAAPHLLSSPAGSIVNIASAMGRFADRGYVAYGTAKAALVHMTRLLALDLAPRVRVNAIAPGSIATDALELVLSDDAMRAEMEAGTPLRRIGEPAEIALAVLYLASPASSYVTGKLLEVDGGIGGSNLDLKLPDLEATDVTPRS
jgi:7-alpha-hydroxysteroid dehydrogenase